ncbi:MAG TPA: hypothetical protein VFA59_18215 [Vicinamibacterales bacterium]|nr:hypothetical protein [Vicinamibacterales bacterium]
MWSFVLRYGAPVILAFTPLLTAQYSLLDVLGYHADGNGELAVTLIPYHHMVQLAGPKAAVEMQLRFLLTMLGVGVLLLQGYFDAFKPSRTLRTFRQDYLEQISKSDWRKKQHIPKSVRINVMYRRFWWVLPIFYFDFVWQDGFDAADRDGSLKLFFFQGVCGRAYRAKNAVFIDMRTQRRPEGFRERWLLGNQFHLWRWQIRKTNNIKAILSIPMLERYGTKGKEKFRCVGLINLDSNTDAGADHLAGHVKDLSVFFAKYGTLIAKMR